MKLVPEKMLRIIGKWVKFPHGPATVMEESRLIMPLGNWEGESGCRRQSQKTCPLHEISAFVTNDDGVRHVSDFLLL